jgi:hypothetical protein
MDTHRRVLLRENGLVKNYYWVNCKDFFKRPDSYQIVIRTPATERMTHYEIYRQNPGNQKILCKVRFSVPY